LIKVLKDYVNILTLPAERLKKTLSRIEYRSSSLHSTPLLNLSALGRSISLNPSVILNFQGRISWPRAFSSMILCSIEATSLHANTATSGLIETESMPALTRNSR